MKATIKELPFYTAEIKIKNLSPLIVHKFSQKTIKELEDKHQKKSKSQKHEIRNPEEEYENAKHISSEGWEGFPAAGFKGAMVRAAKVIGMVMKDVKTSINVIPDCEETQLVKINGGSEMHTDDVRVSNGMPDVRYRPMYKNWTATLRIEYNEGIVSLDQVMQLVYVAGRSVGIGEMRPEKTNHGFGKFEIVQ